MIDSETSLGARKAKSKSYIKLETEVRPLFSRRHLSHSNPSPVRFLLVRHVPHWSSEPRSLPVRGIRMRQGRKMLNVIADGKDAEFKLTRIRMENKNKEAPRVCESGSPLKD